MPGKWHGRKSLEGPTKGTYIEGEVYDDGGDPQGTVVLWVKRLFAPGETGRTLHGDVVTATDPYYRWWLASPDGAVTTVDGAYHICKGPPAECKGGTGEHVVHLGKWRQWKEEELVDNSGGILDEDTHGHVQAYFKRVPKEGPGAGGAGDLPWDDPGDDEEDGEEEKGKSAPGPSGKEKAAMKRTTERKGSEEELVKKKKRLTELARDLKALKAEVKAAEVTEEEKKGAGKKEKKGRKRTKSGKGSPPFSGEMRGSARKVKTSPEPGGSSSEPDSDEGSSSDKSSGRNQKRTSRSRGKKKQRSKGRSSPSDPSRSRSRRRQSHKKKKRGKKKNKRPKDRGPFGVAESDEDPDRSEAEDDSESDFQKAPAGMTLFLKLQRYAQRHPGRLAARLLHTMGVAGRVPVGALRQKGKSILKNIEANAVSYYNVALVPNLKAKWTPRSGRELKYLTILLDLLVENKSAQAADIIAQRIKALEKSVQDNNSWVRARFLELVEPDDVEVDGGALANRIPAEPSEPPDPRGELQRKRKSEKDVESPEGEVASSEEYEIEEEALNRLWKKRRQKFERKMAGFLAEERDALEVAWHVLENAGHLRTKFGRFRTTLGQKATAQDAPEGPDLLPISLDALELRRDIQSEVRAWVILMAWALNFLYCTGWEQPRHMDHPGKLTTAQTKMVDQHLVPAVRRMCPKGLKIPSYQKLKEQLQKKGYGYDGSSWEMVNKPLLTILPAEEWPETVPQSYVRASDAEWERLVAEGYQLGLFQPCPEEEILRSPSGEMILNGAGAVPKEKNGKILQRFISILCPLNAVSRKIEGDESTLPYVGQVGLCELEAEGAIVIDSEDLQSAFNLFEMPRGWRGMFVYRKQVRGGVLGLPHDEMTWVSLRTVPMGWLSAVGIVQQAIRTLAFEEAGLPRQFEIQKNKELPEGERFLLYLDSVDQLRPVSQAMRKVVEGQASPEHQRFEEACRRCGLPTNMSKRLAGALRGTLQGGLLDGEAGVFMLHPDKGAFTIEACMCLLGSRTWETRVVAGLTGRLVFAGAFRRPAMSLMSEVFHYFGSKPTSKVAKDDAYDEVLLAMALLPLSFTNLKASICGRIYATDASPMGAGSCVAERFKRPFGTTSPNDLVCGVCRTELTDETARGEDLACPAMCGCKLCSLECCLRHAPYCPHQAVGVPLFSERYSGPEARLSRTMFKAGFRVVDPIDYKWDSTMDVFTERGKEWWAHADASDPTLEHHAPDSKTFSRARGRPYQFAGKWYEGPVALRDESHVMGFTYLAAHDAAAVRKGNKMAMRSIARCRTLHEEGRFFTLDHPRRSWMWYTKPAIDLAGLPGVRMAIFSHCCYGGRRKKWTSLLTNSETIYQALHKPVCPHGDGEDYPPYWDQQLGQVVFPMEQEATYPWGLCEEYAKAAVNLMNLSEHREEALAEVRKVKIREDLMKYDRLQSPGLQEKVVSGILHMERTMQIGFEKAHLQQLLRLGHYRGTDVRLAVEEQGGRQLFPYPAYRWLWRDVLSFRWRQEGHINELEFQAFLAHIRRVLREPDMRHKRVFVVVDSQVMPKAPQTLRYAGLAKKTVAAYRRALSAFFSYLEDEEIEMPSKFHHLDRLIAQYLESLYLDDTPISYAGHLLSAFRRFVPQSRFKIPIAKQWFSNWTSEHVPRQAIPMPANVVLALAGAALEVEEFAGTLALLWPLKGTFKL
ncbi:unnamed protein product [Durusdinium trenchii]|uniref:Uncharacterized protein n=1 Tax=Durusdinium trenchii TaxID=1381693 RepID=A0ABP0LBV4_9DINO